MMLGAAYNHTMESPATFMLVGIPGLQSSYLCLAIFLSAMYTIALLGNTLIMTVICMDSALQEPMYCFLCVLAAVDIVMASSVVPKMLSIFCSGDSSIGFHACFTQMYFVHASTAVETGLLLAMAFDRYVAICKPLHYSRILTPNVMLGMCVTIFIRAGMFMTPLTWMLIHLPFCGSTVVPHSYCEHMAVAKLACADPMPSSLYSLICSSIIVGSDVTFIAASYVLILRAVFGLSSKKAQRKALSTCGSHVGVMALYYLPGMASIYVAWLGQGIVPLHTQVLLADLYLIIPPTLNPIIYGIRTKQIRQRIWSVLTCCFLPLQSGFMNIKSFRS
ncbi:olfactory receptor 52I1-like [Perognathus longimembris pacificus]|uniref:olfactory receptor 52I1-like n=1 Tax=Perognathus longimembris pacificus TaxID=214514 RepID=UPI00201865AF|nr:olfactory receptor 52I1-like [Perognathus longimembris pacificus]